MKKTLLGISVLVLSYTNTFADVDTSKVPSKKQTPQGKYLTAKEAYNSVKNEGRDILFIDVRTRA